MTAPALDAREHAELWRSLIAARMNGHAYDYDDVPKTLPNIYALVSVERRFTASARATSQASRSSWRLSVRGVGRTIAECQWADKRITEAVEQHRALIGGKTSTLPRHETSNAPKPDDSRHSSLTHWTYSL